MKEVQKFLKDIEKEQNGYSLGEPWKFSKDSMGVVIPILCSREFERDYTTFPEVNKKVNFEDLGGISPIRAKSGVDLPIFVRSGTVLEGISGQDRAVIHSMMLNPDIDIDVKVRCVHASRPTSRGGKFKYSGYAPRVVQKSLGKGQGETWNSVSFYAMSGLHLSPEQRIGGVRGGSPAMYGARAPTKQDDLPSIKKAQLKLDKNLQSILKEVPVLENQIGAIIVGMRGVVGVESFDHSKSWKSQYKEVIEQYSDELAKEAKDSLFSFDDTKIMDITRKFLSDISKATFDMIDVDTFTIRMKGYLGEGARHNGHMVHLFVMENDEDSGDSSPSPSPPHLQPLVGFVQSQPQRDSRVIGKVSILDRTVTKGMKKGYDDIFRSINKSGGMATWSDIANESKLSTATIAKRLKEGKNANIIGEGLSNGGRKVYYKKVNI